VSYERANVIIAPRTHGGSCNDEHNNLEGTIETVEASRKHSCRAEQILHNENRDKCNVLFIN